MDNDLRLRLQRFFATPQLGLQSLLGKLLDTNSVYRQMPSQSSMFKSYSMNEEEILYFSDISSALRGLTESEKHVLSVLHGDKGFCMEQRFHDRSLSCLELCSAGIELLELGKRLNLVESRQFDRSLSIVMIHRYLTNKGPSNLNKVASDKLMLLAKQQVGEIVSYVETRFESSYNGHSQHHRRGL